MEKQRLATAAARSCRILFLAGAVVIAVAPHVVYAKGAPTTYQSKKVFRELIVQGERPEIAACMVAAVSRARHDPKFDAIRWADDVSDTAYMREAEGGTHLTRIVRFKAELREQSGGFFSDTWKAAEIVCEQSDEALPEVRFGLSQP